MRKLWIDSKLPCAVPSGERVPDKAIDDLFDYKPLPFRIVQAHRSMGLKGRHLMEDRFRERTSDPFKDCHRLMEESFGVHARNPWVYRLIRYMKLMIYAEAQGDYLIYNTGGFYSKELGPTPFARKVDEYSIQNLGSDHIDITNENFRGESRSLSLGFDDYRDFGFWKDVEWDDDESFWSPEDKKSIAECFLGGTFDRNGDLIPLQGLNGFKFKTEEEIVRHLREVQVPDYYALSTRHFDKSIVGQEYLLDLLDLGSVDRPDLVAPSLPVLFATVPLYCNPSALSRIRKGLVNVLKNIQGAYFEQMDNGLCYLNGLPDNLVMYSNSAFMQRFYLKWSDIMVACLVEFKQYEGWVVSDDSEVMPCDSMAEVLENWNQSFAEVEKDG